jgi:hypothetical protein
MTTGPCLNFEYFHYKAAVFAQYPVGKCVIITIQLCRMFVERAISMLVLAHANMLSFMSCPYKIVKNATVKGGGGGGKLEDKNSEIALDLDQVRLSIVRVAKRRDRARRFPALLHLARPIPRSSLKFPLSFRLLAMIVGPSLTLGRHKLQHLLGLF